MFDRVRAAAADYESATGERTRVREGASRPRQVLQAKQRVGSSNDPSELAADRFADELVDTLRRRPALDHFAPGQYRPRARETRRWPPAIRSRG